MESGLLEITPQLRADVHHLTSQPCSPGLVGVLLHLDQPLHLPPQVSLGGGLVCHGEDGILHLSGRAGPVPLPAGGAASGGPGFAATRGDGAWLLLLVT